MRARERPGERARLVADAQRDGAEAADLDAAEDLRLLLARITLNT